MHTLIASSCLHIINHFCCSNPRASGSTEWERSHQGGLRGRRSILLAQVVPVLEKQTPAFPSSLGPRPPASRPRQGSHCLHFFPAQSLLPHMAPASLCPTSPQGLAAHPSPHLPLLPLTQRCSQEPGLSPVPPIPWAHCRPSILPPEWI